MPVRNSITGGKEKDHKLNLSNLPTWWDCLKIKTKMGWEFKWMWRLWVQSTVLQRRNQNRGKKQISEVGSAECVKVSRKSSMEAKSFCGSPTAFSSMAPISSPRARWVSGIGENLEQYPPQPGPKPSTFPAPSSNHSRTAVKLNWRGGKGIALWPVSSGWR